MTEGQPAALEGIKVIDWTIWQFGPIASTMLATIPYNTARRPTASGASRGS